MRRAVKTTEPLLRRRDVGRLGLDERAVGRHVETVDRSVSAVGRSRAGRRRRRRTRWTSCTWHRVAVEDRHRWQRCAGASSRRRLKTPTGGSFDDRWKKAFSGWTNPSRCSNEVLFAEVATSCRRADLRIAVDCCLADNGWVSLDTWIALVGGSWCWVGRDVGRDEW